MRTPFAIVLFATILFAGAYVYREVEAVCKVPIAYSIGNIDERFAISDDEARVAIADAESVWEQATGRNLFTFDVDADFTINFVFDERQEFAEAEVDLREKLDVTEGFNEVIGETHEDLVARYKQLELTYDAKVASYEASLSAYNEKVQKYNDEGGAPPDVYAALQKEKEALDRETDTVNALGVQLNGLAREINSLSEKGNELINVYNQNVDQYNNTFGESREFTQGDYQGDTINIYKFVNTNELTLVLAHELGHALSLDHVTNEQSILYHLMGAQQTDLRLTQEDLSEFERVCGESTRSWIERLLIQFGI